MSRWKIARLVAAKDLRIERRSRVVVNQVLPFAAVTMVMFAFALDAKGVRVEDQQVVGVLELVAPGLVWLATLFSLLVLVQRAFAVERDDGALDALQGGRGRPRGDLLGQGDRTGRPAGRCSRSSWSSPPCCSTACRSRSAAWCCWSQP